MTVLVFILGDHLSPDIAALRGCDPRSTTVLLAEVAEETRYVPHHKLKIAFIFAAMRHFAERLEREGWRVRYVRLDDTENTGSFTGEALRAMHDTGASRLRITQPGEHRVAEMIADWPKRGIDVEVLEDDRFLCTPAEFDEWASGRKRLVMEHFYRWMRQRTGLLMEGEQPAGGRWNFDAENRKPAAPNLFGRSMPDFKIDERTREVLTLVEKRFLQNPGKIEKFNFAVTHTDAEAVLDAFIEHGLPQFGDFQDAMLAEDPYLYHAVISMYLNVGLLDARDVCTRVDAAWRAGRVPINAAEGFIRQIIGWREYVRGIYWREMPSYRDRNALGARRPLPDFYWTGETDLACLRAAIGQTIALAYAHHIQRLMVTGNFALLIGVDPVQIHEWYLAVYADAFEWVELPNTLGMSQFADGGLLGSKPYAASGAYINRMSDYCAGCAFDVTKRTGAGACPLNALYWDFLARNRAVLGGNRRLAMPYATWDRMPAEQQTAYREAAEAFLSRLDASNTSNSWAIERSTSSS